MLERHDALGRPRLALAQGEHLGFRPDGVAGQHRLGKGHLLEAEIADRRSQRRILHGEADDEAQREYGIDQRAAELGGLGVFMIDVDRRRIVGQGGEQDVVHVRNRASDFMNEGLPDLELLEIFAGHRSTPSGAAGFLPQAVHGLRFAETGEFEVSQRDEILRQIAREGGGADDGPAEPRGDFLQPRRHVDRGADAGEIEPRAGADIAVERLADVKRKPGPSSTARSAAILASACRAARSARARTASISPSSAMRKIASRPSPMNFSTSPPSASIAGTRLSKKRLSSSISAAGAIVSARLVKPRMSESQITARIVSLSPRRMRPARMRSPASRPT